MLVLSEGAFSLLSRSPGIALGISSDMKVSRIGEYWLIPTTEGSLLRAAHGSGSGGASGMGGVCY